MAGQEWPREPKQPNLDEKKKLRAAHAELENAIRGLKGISPEERKDLETRLEDLKHKIVASDC